jgi:N-acylglucosamine-6-phosphate 2-epimerase
MHPLAERLRGLIVSCQVAPDEPMYGGSEAEGIRAAAGFARAAAAGGAVAIRANTPNQIRAIKKEVSLPVIGLYKQVRPGSDIYITPTMEAAKAVWEAGAEIIAADATLRRVHKNDGTRLANEIIKDIRREIPAAVIFADIATLQEAEAAVAYGADIIAPTLFGYTAETENAAKAPNAHLAFLKELCLTFSRRVCIIMEGGISTPEQAAEAIRIGANAVVVGSAVTRPHLITKRFADAVQK